MAAVAPQIKNKRLSDRDRSALVNYASRRIKETQDRAALDDAYEHAAEAISAAYAKLYPPKDMRVLVKYDAATDDSCIYISTGGWNYDQFEFRSDDKRTPLRPRRAGCNSRSPILLEGDAREAYEAFDYAKKAFEAATNQRLDDYRALISSSTSFNAIAEVWPDAEHLRVQIVGSSSALILLNDDVVARLRADPANAHMAEAA